MTDDLEIVPTDRQVISQQLLSALDDTSKVAILATQDDLCMLIHALASAPAEWGEKRTKYLRDLRKLKEAAFGT